MTVATDVAVEGSSPPAGIENRKDGVFDGASAQITLAYLHAGRTVAALVDHVVPACACANPGTEQGHQGPRRAAGNLSDRGADLAVLRRAERLLG